jgi:four helix bundle protein
MTDSTIRSYRDLIVWQKGMDFCTDVYTATKAFPKEELFGLTQQVRRAVVSTPSNIAEGYGRGSTSEYVHFLRISRGSLFEAQTQLEIARRLEYISPSVLEPLNALSIEIEKMLNSMISKLAP